MNNHLELIRIRNILVNFIVINFNRMPLNCSNIELWVFFNYFKSLFIVVLNNVLHIINISIFLFKLFMI